jgi:tripartite ATP-independent transporter DctP family solute receptor
MKLKRISIGVTAAAALLLSACGGGGAIPEQPASTGGGEESVESVEVELTIRYASIQAENSPIGIALNEMKDAISEASGGSIEMELFLGSTLGSEQDHIEAVREGSVELMESGTAGISLFVPETALFELWYANDSVESLVGAFEAVSPELDERYATHGFKLLGAFYDGPRHIISTEPIRSLEDMQGIKMRVPGSDLYVQMANGLGSQATALPFGDVYTGLQNTTIDGAEGSPTVLLTQGWGEVAKYVTLDAHVYQPLSIIFTLETWNSLTAEQQSIIENAINAASEKQLALLLDANDTALAALEELGVELIVLEDREAWKARIQPAIDNFNKSMGEDGQLILDALYR